MTNTNDSFIREVNEELRQDRMKAVWTRFGLWMLAGAILVILVTAGVLLWQRHQADLAAADGDRFLAASELVEGGKPEEALPAFEALAADGSGSYPTLARLRVGELHQAAGRSAEALAAFDAVANDNAAPGNLRDIAALRAAYILVDTGSRADVEARVGRLDDEANPLRYGARETIALAAWKAGDAAAARPLLQGLLDDRGTPNGIASRARILLAVIDAAAPPPAAEPAATPAAPPAPPAGDAPPAEPATTNTN